MENVFKKYKIDDSLPKNQKLAVLEKEKLKVLRKLNHVFGNPEKEKELNTELEALERVMMELEESGGTLSLDDVLIESRGLTQTKIEAGGAKEEDSESIRKKERLVKSEDTGLEDRVTALYDLLVYYLKRQEYVQYEYWLLYGAKCGYPFCMYRLYNYYTDDVFDAYDDQKALYWVKQGADLGEKDCCENLGMLYANENYDMYDPMAAAMCFVKAADSNHPNSYIYAFQMFHRLGQYQKAETCLKAADQLRIPGAAHWMGMIYYNGENSTGEKDMELAQYWFEQEYQRHPCENICIDLGGIYLVNREIDKALAVFERGVREFDSEACRGYLRELR